MFGEDSRDKDDVLVEPAVYSFDVSKRGEYLGIPRIEETLMQAYKDLDIDHKKVRTEIKQAFCITLDNKLRRIWDALQGMWLDYRDACYAADEDSLFELAIEQELQLKNDELHEEVELLTLFREKQESPYDMREFIE